MTKFIYFLFTPVPFFLLDKLIIEESVGLISP